MVLPCNICVVRENVAGNVSLRATVGSEAIPSFAGRRLLPFDKLRTGVAPLPRNDIIEIWLRLEAVLWYNISRQLMLSGLDRSPVN